MTYGAITSDLFRRYAGPTRHYHDERHVAEVLTEVERLTMNEVPIEPIDYQTVRWAAWFHDAIYNEDGVVDPEVASAALARRMLANESDEALDEVERLILLTKHHQVEPGDRRGAVLCDADLWILSADDLRYDEYVAGVREEYRQYDDATWQAGRMKFVLDFMGRARRGGLYRFGSDVDRARRNDRAFYNLGRELIGTPTYGRPVTRFELVDSVLADLPSLGVQDD